MAVVTGASRGLGRAIAVALAAAGADVSVAARSKADLEETARQVEGQGRRALVVPTDVSRFVTDMNAAAFGDPRTRERLTRDIPARRTGRLDEIGPLAVYLASPASDFMTGQTLYLDGGHAAA